MSAALCAQVLNQISCDLSVLKVCDRKIFSPVLDVQIVCIFFTFANRKCRCNKYLAPTIPNFNLIFKELTLLRPFWCMKTVFC